MINLDHVNFQHKTVIYFDTIAVNPRNCVAHDFARACSDKFPTCYSAMYMHMKYHVVSYQYHTHI
jgi:hypothetical protein